MVTMVSEYDAVDATDVKCLYRTQSVAMQCVFRIERRLADDNRSKLGSSSSEPLSNLAAAAAIAVTNPLFTGEVVM